MFQKLWWEVEQHNMQHMVKSTAAMEKNYISSFQFSVLVTISGFSNEKHILDQTPRIKSGWAQHCGDSRLSSGHQRRGYHTVKTGPAQVWNQTQSPASSPTRQVLSF